MRHIRLQLSVVFLLGLGLTNIQAQTIYVKPTTGDQTQYSVSDIRRMTFSAGNISITKTTGSSEYYSLTGMRYLSFTNYIVGIDYSGQDKRQRIIQLYPNPASNYITVVVDKVQEASGVIEILSLEGRVLIIEQIAGKQKVFIGLNTLSKGIYFCRYRAGSTSKTVKIVKL